MRFIDSKEPITIQELADTMHLSRSTIENSLSEIREYLQKFEVEIIGSNKGLSIVANESQKRKIISEIIKKYWYGVMATVDQSQNQSINIILNQQSSLMIDTKLMEEVQLLVNQFIEDNHLELSDYQYQSLVIHITIAIDRIQKSFFVESPVINPEELISLTVKLISLLESKFSIKIPAIERNYLNIHLMAIDSCKQLMPNHQTIDSLEYGHELIEILENVKQSLYI